MLADSFATRDFRVILAQPLLVDVLVASGYDQHLDGLFAMFPGWVKQMKQAVAASDWRAAAKLSNAMGQSLPRMFQDGVFPAMTALLNARGIPGSFSPRPYPRLTRQQCESLTADPLISELNVAT